MATVARKQTKLGSSQRRVNLVQHATCNVQRATWATCNVGNVLHSRDDLLEVTPPFSFRQLSFVHDQLEKFASSDVPERFRNENHPSFRHDLSQQIERRQSADGEGVVKSKAVRTP
jgi:hypothetical protein